MDIARLMQLEEDARIWKATAMLYYRMYLRLQDAYNTIMAMLPPRLRTQIYVVILMKNALGGVPGYGFPVPGRGEGGEEGEGKGG